MTEFVHLHVHSHYSFLKGLAKVPRLVKTAKERGFGALALTDTGGMYGTIEFYRKCLAEDIQPIIGVELFHGPRLHTDKDSQEDKDVFQIVLLAETFEGYQNLMRLVSESHLEGFFNGHPRLDIELLKKYGRGLIALSGNITGQIPSLLLANKYNEAKTLAERFDAVLGRNNFFLELQDHPAISGQLAVNNSLLEISKETGIPAVVTRDVHYINPDDAEAQDIHMCIGKGWKVDQTDRNDFRQVDRSLNTGEDILSRFRHTPHALENTVKIAERCKFEIPLDNWHFAPVEIPPGKTADEFLRDEAYRFAPDFYTEITDEIRERINYELGIIEKKGYAPYFVCVADYVRYAKEHGIVESTRGSAAGSLVSYVLGITTVDPIRFKLPFERFLNPFRPSPPDIDTDFADDRRDEMIAYVTEKYGKDKVAQIITFGTMAARASVRDVGRVLGFSYNFCDQVAKLIPPGAQGFPMTIERALKEEPDLKKLYDGNDDVRKLLNFAIKVEGCARHTSIHAAGVVISPTPLTDFTPVQRETGGDKITTQYEMHSVESAGVLKNDFLGIRNLAILGNAVEIVQKTTGDKVDIYNLSLEDGKVFEMLSRGETMGVFQFAGSGMTRWTKELKPTRIEDIMAMVALYRPGPMESIPEYIRRKYNPDLVTYFDPRLEKILDASYGLLVYQDDVMLTAIELAGYDWMEADKFRKAMGKKIPEEMAKQKQKFYDGCKTHGKLDTKIIDEMWHAIEPFAAYGFNKCLAGDTEIVDPATGTLNTIKDLYNKKTVSVLSVGEDFKIKARHVPKIYKNGKKKTYRLVTRTGREIVTTPNHRFRTCEGWKEQKDLHIGEYIAVPRAIRYAHSKKTASKKLKVLGYLISEGNLCHTHGLYFYSSKRHEVDDFVTAAQVFKNVVCTVSKHKSSFSVYVGKKDVKKESELREYIKAVGLWGKKAVDKYVPGDIFEISKKDLGVFIGALWQGDGCIKDDKNGQIYYATSSKKLAAQLQHLLLRLEIISTIHTKKFKYNGSVRDGYTVHISKYDNVKKFAYYVGPHLLEDKKKELDLLLRHNNVLNKNTGTGVARGTNDIVPACILGLIQKEMQSRGVAPKQVALEAACALRLLYMDKRRKGYRRETLLKIGKYLRSRTICEYADSDIYWDEIVDIKKDKVQETYDLTVPGNHNFIANDIVVHNSHAASYGIVAYQTAYMKAHYPVQFMTSVLAAEAGDADKIAAIAHECRRMGIDVLPPDINESFKNFAMTSKPGEPGKIRFGLTAVKNVGEHICSVIYRERKEHGTYTDLENFLERVQDKDLNKKSLESLIKVGAMDCFGHDRGVLLDNIENILSFLRHNKEQQETKQDSLFTGTAIAFDNKVKLAPGPEATLEDKLLWEKDLIGVYVSSHPFAKYEKQFRGIVTDLNAVEELSPDTWVIVGGVIDSVTRKITKKGSVMLFVTLQDESGSVELLVFPKKFEETKDMWVEGEVVCVVAKTPREEGDTKLFVEKLYILSPETAANVARTVNFGAQEKAKDEKEKSITLLLTKEQLQSKGQELRKLFFMHPGDYVVYIRVGTQLIKSESGVEWKSGVADALYDLIGKDRVVVHE